MLQYLQCGFPNLSFLAALGSAGHRLGADLLWRYQVTPTTDCTSQQPQGTETESVKRPPVCCSTGTGLPMQYEPPAAYTPTTRASLTSVTTSWLRLMVTSHSQLGFSLRPVTVRAGSSRHVSLSSSLYCHFAEVGLSLGVAALRHSVPSHVILQTPLSLNSLHSGAPYFMSCSWM